MSKYLILFLIGSAIFAFGLTLMNVDFLGSAILFFVAFGLFIASSESKKKDNK